MVEDLREEIEKLRSENGRLMDELLGRGKKGERKKREMVKETIKKMEVEVIEAECHVGDGSGDTDEE